MTQPIFIAPDLAERQGLAVRAARRLHWLRNTMGAAFVRRGVPPALLGHRFRQRVSATVAACDIDNVHPAARDTVPLAGGFAGADELPAERGWWPFSFREVPRRNLDATNMLTFADAKVLALRGGTSGEYSPALIDHAGRTIDMREIRHRPFHGPLARRKADLVLDEALWIAERVFDNYSHWLTAHLPKLVLLRERKELSSLVLPARRPAWLDSSLRRIGIGSSDFCELPTPGVLEARRLRVIECDRFRPELLCAARAALVAPAGSSASADKRIFISRRKARGRMLLEENELETLLMERGFELVAMEGLTFDEQAELMARAAVLLAPHGAGLANMIFCPPGAVIGEIADPAYPNPNFYAMAGALGHRYHYIAGCGVGDRHPLRQDLSVQTGAVRAFLDTLA